MPRRSSGGRSAPRMTPRPAPVKNPPQTAAPAPPPAPRQSSPAVGGIGSSIADGLAWGTGTAVAHRVADSILGPRTVTVQHEQDASASQSAAPAAASAMSNAVHSDACIVPFQALQDCMNRYGTDISKCQFYMDMLNECRRGSGSMLSA